MRELATSRYGAVALTLLLASCGKKATGTEIGPGGARLALPEGTNVAGLEIHLGTVVDVPPPLMRTKPVFDEHLKLLKVIDMTPDGTAVPKGTLTVRMEAGRYPPGRELFDSVVFGVTSDGTVEDLAFSPAPDALKIEVEKFETIVIAVPPETHTLLGAPAALLGGASPPLRGAECPDWITPDSPGVAAIAKDPARLKVSASELTLTPPLAIADAPATKQVKADESLARSNADRTNASYVYASLLLAKGYPVRLVGGHATLVRDGKTRKGYHQWVETKIDDKILVVDTLAEKPPVLLPHDEAVAAYKLAEQRACAKFPPGMTTDPFVPAGPTATVQ